MKMMSKKPTRSTPVKPTVKQLKKFDTMYDKKYEKESGKKVPKKS